MGHRINLGEIEVVANAWNFIDIGYYMFGKKKNHFMLPVKGSM